jgi:glycosyltransferase involved in cell wall biosynthesis
VRIAVWHDLPPGGGRRAFNELLRRLAQRHTITLFRLSDRLTGPMSENNLDIRVVEVPFHPHRPIRYGLYWNDWLLFRHFKDLESLEQDLAATIDADGYDVALVSTLRWAYAPAITKYLKMPCVYYCHEPPRRLYEPWARPEAGPLSRYERLRLRWRYPTQKLLDRYIRVQDIERVRAASLVLTNSSYTARGMGQIYNRTVEVAYLGVDIDRFKPGEEPNLADSVISVGQYEAHKGFDFLIHALTRLPVKQRPNLILVGMRGNPRLPDHLQKIAHDEGVVVELYQGIADRDLVSLYQSASIFVFGSRFEPFGLVVLEAMASGLPVVAVAEGGVPEMVVEGRTGYLVPRDPDAFASAVLRLLETPEIRVQMGRVARSDVLKSWTWEQAAERLESHLMQASKGTASPALEESS